MAEFHIVPDDISDYLIDVDHQALTVGTIFYVEDPVTPNWLCEGIRMPIKVGTTHDLSGCWATLWEGVGPERVAVRSKPFSGALTPGWNEVRWDIPYVINAEPASNPYYMAAVYLPAGGYAYKDFMFQNPYQSPNDGRIYGAANSEVDGNGRFVLGVVSDPENNPAWPLNNFNLRHYGPDVILNDAGGDADFPVPARLWVKQDGVAKQLQLKQPETDTGLNWQPWLIGSDANGWRSYKQVTGDTAYEDPQYAIKDGLVYLRGVLDGQLATDAPIVPSDATPAFHQRIYLSNSNGGQFYDIWPDGTIRSPAGAPSIMQFLVLHGSYPL